MTAYIQMISAQQPKSPSRRTIAAVVVARNEGEILGPCLESVKGLVDELVVVDLESQDNTRAVASAAGATILSHAPVPYADPVREFGLQHTTSQWILLLDPDEQVREGLALEIRRIIEEDNSDVVFLPYLNSAFGRELRSPGGIELPHPRLFRRGCLRWPSQIHTNPDLTGLRCYFVNPHGAKPYANVIAHHPWRTPHEVLDKFGRYVKDEAARRDACGARFRLRTMLYRSMREFGGRYIAGRAYEDGLPGLFFAWMYTVYEMGVQMELWQLQGSPAAGDRALRRTGRVVGEPLRWVFPLWMRRRDRARAASGEVNP
jgi:(heptosyl)LPS beta-1,4-glucosyltransferase